MRIHQFKSIIRITIKYNNEINIKNIFCTYFIISNSFKQNKEKKRIKMNDFANTIALITNSMQSNIIYENNIQYLTFNQVISRYLYKH